MGTAKATGSGPVINLPWLVAGVSVVLLIVVAVVKFNTGSEQPFPPQPTQPLAPTGASGTTDISQMTPRERANALFNRVVREAEAGNMSQVEFFAPMAIQSYELLGTWDDDARYDVAIIYSLTSQFEEALAQADTIEQSAPNHLLAKVVRAEVARMQGDQEALMNAYRSFLAAYDSEIIVQRPEYQAHQRTVSGFRDEAQQAVQGN